jgi:uncharacterized radical SAM superfamily protein
MPGLNDKLKQARDMSWQTFGKRITFYLPGMFSYYGLTGKYPAISITGSKCALECDHCGGGILRSMMASRTPYDLIETCLRLWKGGNHGVLISGGCDEEGRLPWKTMIGAIAEVKRRTDLYVSVHSGLIDYPTALRLREAGVDQALIDVIGDDETFQRIYHVDFGVSRIASSLDALQRAGLPIVPHLVCGLYFGRIKGEREAIRVLSRFDLEQVVVVSLMRIRGTPMGEVPSPDAEEIADIIAETRLNLPQTRISLGCARQRGNTRLGMFAIDAGVNRMALPPEEVIQRARDYGLEVRYQQTCCSISRDLSKEEW